MKEKIENTQATINNTTNNTNKKGTNKMKKAELKELTIEQRATLENLSKEILGNLKKNYALGKALIEVKELLTGSTEKFEPYCREHFNLGHSQVNRLMNYAKVRNVIGMTDPEVYISENTFRNISKFTPATQKAIWKKAVSLAGNNQLPTAVEIEEAAKEFQPTTDKKSKRKISKEFFCRVLNTMVDLNHENAVDVIRKASSVSAVKSVIKEVAQRVKIMKKDRQAICAIIMEKANSEAMELMGQTQGKKKTVRKELEQAA